jgi:hypothetical protein
MNYDLASEIYEKLEGASHPLRLNLYRAAVHYAGIRAKWQLASPQERHEMNLARTAAHDIVIQSLDVLTREMEKQGLDVSWRGAIGEHRKDIGDFAVFLTAYFGILAR